MELREFLRDDGNGHLEFVWHPGSTAESRLNQYRRALGGLGQFVVSLVLA
jgi:hypothetical protein